MKTYTNQKNMKPNSTCESAIVACVSKVSPASIGGIGLERFTVVLDSGTSMSGGSVVFEIYWASNIELYFMKESVSLYFKHPTHQHRLQLQVRCLDGCLQSHPRTIAKPCRPHADILTREDPMPTVHTKRSPVKLEPTRKKKHTTTYKTHL